MNITSNIFQVGGSEESHPSDASIYMLVSRDEAVLVDAGTGWGHDRVMNNIQMLGLSPANIKYLFLTHCHFDHTGGANRLRKATGCQLLAHKLDSCFLEQGDNDVTGASWYGSAIEKTLVDIIVEGKNAKFKTGDMEIDFYHAPGHSPGSSVLATRSDGKLVLFGQDIHGPLNDVLLSSRKDYEESLEFMLSLQADILCEGHFGVFFGKDEVRDFIESYL